MGEREELDPARGEIGQQGGEKETIRLDPDGEMFLTIRLRKRRKMFVPEGEERIGAMREEEKKEKKKKQS